MNNKIKKSATAIFAIAIGSAGCFAPVVEAESWAKGTSSEGTGEASSGSGISSESGGSGSSTTMDDGDSTGSRTMADADESGDVDSTGDDDFTSAATTGDGDDSSDSSTGDGDGDLSTSSSTGDGDGDSSTTDSSSTGDGDAGIDQYPGELCDPFIDTCVDYLGDNYVCGLDTDFIDGQNEYNFKCYLRTEVYGDGFAGSQCVETVVVNNTCQDDFYCAPYEEVWPPGACSYDECCSPLCVYGEICGDGSECLVTHFADELTDYLDVYIGIGYCLI